MTKKEIENGEILYCNLKVKHKKKEFLLKEVVYKQNIDKTFYNKRILDKINIKEKVDVFNVEIIERLGFENKSKEYTEVKKNDNNNRNEITGAYE